MTIWIVQPGEGGAFDAASADFVPLFLSGWPDLTHISAHALRTWIRQQYPDDPPERTPFYFDPVWAFINDIQIEDIIAFAQPGRDKVYLYEVTGGYAYQADAPTYMQHRKPAKLIKSLPLEHFAQYDLLPQSAGVKVKQISDSDAVKFLNVKLSIGPARKAQLLQWFVVGMMIINLLVIMLGSFKSAHILK